MSISHEVDLSHEVGEGCLPRAVASSPREVGAGASDCSPSLLARLERHHCFDIDLDVLWQTVTEDLPALLDRLPELDD